MEKTATSDLPPETLVSSHHRGDGLAMLRITSSRFVALALGLCTSATPAEVKLARMFVAAASGDDDDDCSRLTPCRTSAAALSGKIRAT